MKKILSILSTISLSTITSTNIIACQQPNTNNNNQPIKPQFIPQQPPQNSNWKLLSLSSQYFQSIDNKYYFIIYRINKNYNNWQIIKFKNDTLNKNLFPQPLSLLNVGSSYLKDYFKSIYRWDNVNEPTTPTIDISTGEITEWNE